jgi:hypothetical protein
MGSGYKNFTAGAVLTASDVNNYLMEQGVMYFATTAARDAALTAEDGMTVYIGSNDASEGLYTYNGTAWRRGPGWNAPWGVVAYTETGSNTVASDVVTGLNTTFTAVANRRYAFRVCLHGGNTVNAYRIITDVKEGANLIGRIADLGMSASTNSFPTPNGSCYATFTAGSKNITVTWQVVTGTNALSAGAGFPHFLCIEDIGPSGAPT